MSWPQPEVSPLDANDDGTGPLCLIWRGQEAGGYTPTRWAEFALYAFDVQTKVLVRAYRLTPGALQGSESLLIQVAGPGGWQANVDGPFVFLRGQGIAWRSPTGPIDLGLVIFPWPPRRDEKPHGLVDAFKAWLRGLGLLGKRG